MDTSRSSQILREWAAVASEARRPMAAPRPVSRRSGVSAQTLAGATLVAVLLAAVVVWRAGGPPNAIVGTSPSPVASPAVSPLRPSPSPIASPSPVASSSAVAARSAAPTATPVPTLGPCDPTVLDARITAWEGAAGHRVADVEVRNTGSVPCTMPAAARPQLTDGNGSVLIDGSAPKAPSTLTVPPAGVLTTLVQAGNYCGPAPEAPVTVSFVLGAGRTVVAAPPSPTDATVPPCLGSGQPATIEMQPWTR